MSQSKDFPDSFHRVSIKGLYVKDGKVLLALESPEISGQWELPGGGLDFGEDIHEGFKREVKEETGLTVTKISEYPLYVWTHKFEGRRNMEWYYSFVVAYRIELENLDFTPSDECQELQFFSKEDLQTVDLNEQSTYLKDIFNPDDFKEW